MTKSLCVSSFLRYRSGEAPPPTSDDKRCGLWAPFTLWAAWPSEVKSLATTPDPVHTRASASRSIWRHARLRLTNRSSFGSASTRATPGLRSSRSRFADARRQIKCQVVWRPTLVPFDISEELLEEAHSADQPRWLGLAFLLLGSPVAACTSPKEGAPPDRFCTAHE